MPDNFYIYKFAEFELVEKEEKLFRNLEEIHLTETEFKILLLLLQHGNESVSRMDIFEEVWGMDSDAGENNISVHIYSLRKKLGGDLERYIKTEKKKKGFSFVEPVEKYKRNKNYSVTGIFTEDNSSTENETFQSDEDTLKTARKEVKAEPFGRQQSFAALIGSIAAATLFYLGFSFYYCFAECFEQNTFIALASAFYAILVCIGVFLECAYEFDRYGWRALKMMPFIFLTAAGGIFAALSVAQYRLNQNKVYAIAEGCFVLLCGSGIYCFLAFFLLPSKQITAAKFSTQSAFGAFCKNTFIYFFPVYSIFGIAVFSLIYGGSKTFQHTGVIVGLFILFLTFVVISHFGTTHLLQNLRTPKEGIKYQYYGLFSNLIWFRQIFLFGPALLSLLYYLGLIVK